jgi:hypothetical protein
MPCRGEEEEKRTTTTTRTTWPRDFSSLFAGSLCGTINKLVAAAVAGGLWCLVEREREGIII